MLLALEHHLARYDINLLLLADKQQSQATLTRLLRSGAVDALIVGHTTPEDSRLHALPRPIFVFWRWAAAICHRPMRGLMLITLPVHSWRWAGRWRRDGSG